MTFRRRWLLALYPVVLLAGLGSLPLAAQPAAPPAAPSQPSPPFRRRPLPQQAYTLPPDKLAKAIALSRIRNILNLAGSIWGIVFLWLLLAFRRWAGIEKWAQRISNRRWVQGLVFFAAYIVITALAGAVLDAISNHYERAYGISVQGWGSWLGDQAKALALTLLFARTGSAALQLDCAPLARRYWLGIWVVTLPILVFSLLILAAACSALLPTGAAPKESCRSGGEDRDRGGAHRNRYSAQSHVPDQGQREIDWDQCVCGRSRTDQAVRDVGYDHGSDAG